MLGANSREMLQFFMLVVVQLQFYLVFVILDAVATLTSTWGWGCRVWSW